MIRKYSIAVLFMLVIALPSCKKYLDVVPDNIPEVEMAFNMRATAERYLFTCYSWMPSHGDIYTNPAFTAGDELWYSNSNEGGPWSIGQGWQGVVNVYTNYWDGSIQIDGLYKGIRDCNIFIDNVQKVPDMPKVEKDRWEAEAKFLKAYYHFWLLRMYGPIHLIHENLPISADVNQVKLHRETIDKSFDYIVNLIDESMPDLPDDISDKATEAGRMTKAIAKSIKSYILVTAASPLFNGNTDYSSFLNENNEPFFNQTHDPKKWELALEAAREAIQFSEGLGYHLYKYTQGVSQFTLAPSTITQLSIRNSLAERWNEEVIWANTNSIMTPAIQAHFMGHVNPQYADNWAVSGRFAPTLKMAHLFYSKNGVPINEDKDYDYNGRYDLKVVGTEDRYNLLQGYTTVGLHFNREDRFYASLGFDGGIWYGHGKLDDKATWSIQAKKGQFSAPTGTIHYSATGYFAKKIPHYESIIGTVGNYTSKWYPWPEMRLSNLYLLYAEASNEVNGPGADAYKYIDKVRERAGLLGVVESWTSHSTQANKINSKEGLRSILQQERGIELAFEAQRFWDLRRWKTAQQELNTSIQGWDYNQTTPANYYRVNTLLERTFSLRDYFWPLQESSIQVNRNLVQNPGW